MALIRSSLLSTINGSIGGTTYANNRGGAYARNRSRPNNPRTSQQTRARTQLAQFAARWTTVLTAAQRLAWNNYAALVNAQNRIGESIVLTGQQCYVRANINLSLAGLSSIVTPGILPNPQISLSPQTVQYGVALDKASITLDLTYTGTVLAFSGPLQSTGSQTTKVPFRFFGALAVSALTSIGVVGTNSGRRAYIIGNEMTWRFVGVTPSGQVSNEVILRGVAVT